MEPLDEELPVVEQLLDIWLLERYPALLPYAITSSSEDAKMEKTGRCSVVQTSQTSFTNVRIQADR